MLVLRTVLLFIVILFLAQAEKPAVLFDYDGDGKTDLVIGRLDQNNYYNWYILQSRDGFSATPWGGVVPNLFADGLIQGDYDGDGRTDIAVVRSTGGKLQWWILNSRDNSFFGVEWGTSNDRPVPQDYDGDGKTDIAVYRSGLWLILKSSDGQPYSKLFGGTSPGHPPDNAFTGGDYDGDGKADVSVVRYTTGNPGDPIPTTQYIRLSKDGTWAGYNLGDGRVTGVLSGDYDGDGKSDVAIWQGNLWLWVRSSDGQPEGIRWGSVSQDIPVPGDYDGDGRTDPAVYHRGCPTCTDTRQSFYWIMGSRDGLKVIPWGLSGDTLGRDSRGYLAPIGF